MSERFDLERFVEAQAQAYDTALAELRRGTKRSHWMWYVFPQIVGLGQSPMAQLYAIGSLDEARAFLDHPVLGLRYRECVSALQDLSATSAEAVFGATDAMKLRSSLTLFEGASGDQLFAAALDRWFGGVRDSATLNLLERAPLLRSQVRAVRSGLAGSTYTQGLPQCPA